MGPPRSAGCGAPWGRGESSAAPRRNPPVLMGNRAVANRGISAGPPAGIRREGEGLQPPLQG